MPGVPALARFRKLVVDISRFYVDARRAQVRFGWPAGSLREATGRRVVEEEQDGAMRAAYGTELIPKLSKSLTEKYGPGFSDNVLWNMWQFYLLNPIIPTSGELEWSDYVELLPVKDEKTRKRLERRILKENLNTVQIRQLVRAIRREPGKEPSTLPPLKRPADLRLDTFSVSPLRSKLKDTEVFIDCPETGATAGGRAKKFVEQLLPAGAAVVVKSYKWKTDPHGRFVADVFYKQGIADARDILEDGAYLNQELLDSGHAVRMAAY